MGSEFMAAAAAATVQHGHTYRGQAAGTCRKMKCTERLRLGGDGESSEMCKRERHLRREKTAAMRFKMLRVLQPRQTERKVYG